MSIGEAACVSVHGANRLGSNSLLDLVVFGRSSAKRCGELLSNVKKNKTIKKYELDKIIDEFMEVKNCKGDCNVAKIRTEMQHTMQKYCAVYRNEESLKKEKKIFKNFSNKQNQFESMTVH